MEHATHETLLMKRRYFSPHNTQCYGGKQGNWNSYFYVCWIKNYDSYQYWLSVVIIWSWVTHVSCDQWSMCCISWPWHLRQWSVPAPVTLTTIISDNNASVWAGPDKYWQCLEQMLWIMINHVQCFYDCDKESCSVISSPGQQCLDPGHHSTMKHQTLSRTISLCCIMQCSMFQFLPPDTVQCFLTCVTSQTNQ